MPEAFDIAVLPPDEMRRHYERLAITAEEPLAQAFYKLSGRLHPELDIWLTEVGEGSRLSNLQVCECFGNQVASLITFFIYRSVPPGYQQQVMDQMLTALVELLGKPDLGIRSFKTLERDD